MADLAACAHLRIRGKWEAIDGGACVQNGERGSFVYRCEDCGNPWHGGVYTMKPSEPQAPPVVETMGDLNPWMRRSPVVETSQALAVLDEAERYFRKSCNGALEHDDANFIERMRANYASAKAEQAPLQPTNEALTRERRLGYEQAMRDVRSGPRVWDGEHFVAGPTSEELIATVRRGMGLSQWDHSQRADAALTELSRRLGGG